MKSLNWALHSARPTKQRITRRRFTRLKIWLSVPEVVAATSLFIVGGVHGWLAQNVWSEAHYAGITFGLHALLSWLCALNLVRGDRLIGWLGGALICISGALAYLVSRTVGLPLLPDEPAAWLQAVGVLCLCAEAVFTLVFMRAFVYDDDKDQL